MKYTGIISVVIVSFVLIYSSTACATVLDNSSGTLPVGTKLTAESEGTVTLHPPIGDITCNFSFVVGTLENAGSSSTTVSSKITEFTMDFCNATFHIIKLGTFEIHTFGSGIDNNGRVTLTESEWTITAFGIHCIFTTKNTTIGTLTGSTSVTASATLDIEATIPRTGGSAFCGSTAQWTGSYKFTSPIPLKVT